MKLIIATPFLETCGGMERVVLKIAEHFDARIECLNYNPENTFEGFKNLEVNSKRQNSKSKLPFGKRLFGAIDAGNYFYNLKLNPTDYDIINAHQTPSEWIRNKNSPVIWYNHSPNREAFDLYEWRMKRRNILSKVMFWASIKAYKYFEFRTVPKIEYVFTNSKNSQARIKKYLHLESEILYPGVEFEKFSCKSFDQFFFYPARIVPEKDLEFAIEAFKKFLSAHPKGKDGRWKLIICGSLSKRPEHIAYFNKVRAMCQQIAGGSIIIETNVSEERLHELYACCYAVLYTPVNEDYGLIPAEASSSSKPCIARNEGGPKETIIDGVDGFLVNSPDELSERMQLLAKDPERAVAMGKSGRKKVEKNFTWDVFLSRFDKKAKEIIETHSNKNTSAIKK